MPLELAKETMVWREEAGRQASQILLEGDVIVPDSKPDLQELLRCEGSVKIRDKRVSDDRIGFSGELELLVLYAGKNGEQPLYTMKSSLPMEDFIHMDGLEPDMEITLDANLEHLDCEIINDRKLRKKPVVISTNLEIPALMDQYSDRVMSRLIGEYTVMKFFGEDMRMKKKYQK